MSLWQSAFSRRGGKATCSDPWADRDLWIKSSSRFAKDNDTTTEVDDFGDRPDIDERALLDSEELEEAIPADAVAERYEAEAEESFHRHGFEAIAWYAPISFYGPDQWGIYFHEPRFWGYCSLLTKQLGGATLLGVARDVFNGLDRHEAFHAAVELFALISQDQSNSYGNPFGNDLYPAYFQSHYLPTWGTQSCIEESLATASQFNCRFRTKGLRALLQRQASLSIGGYREWGRYASTRRFRRGLFELTATKIIAGTPNGMSHIGRLTAAAAAGVVDPEDGWWFPDVSPRALDRIGPMPRYAARQRGSYTKLFPPSVLGSIRIKDIIRDACSLYGARVSGGHAKHSRQLVFPGLPGRGETAVPIPNRDGVPHYLMKQIANAVGKAKQDVLRDFGLL
jgi:hypothetical protein